ncbi:MAG: hypothetical protein LWX56_07435 [Ignavibacteria bacterium]|nr:hypothetical protein [Ignavibacteria bacterium]
MAENMLERFKHPAAILILITVVAIYAPLWNSDVFYLFDHQYIESASKVVQGDTPFTRVFSQAYYPDFYYRPVTALSYIVDYFAGSGNIATFHITNILLHGFVCVGLFYLLCMLGIIVEVSFWCTLIFALHPIHMNAVGWIAGRADLLAGFFAMISLLLFISYLRTKKIYILIIATLPILFSLLAKEQMILLPAIMFLYLGVRLKFKQNFHILLWGAIVLSIPLFLYSVLRVFGITSEGAPPISLWNGFRNVHEIPETIARFFVPIQQYTLPVADYVQVLTGCSFLIILPLLGFFLYKKNHVITFFIALIWFFTFFLPGIFAAPMVFGELRYFDCRSYVPLMGFIFPLATMFELFYDKIRQFASPIALTVVGGLAVLMIFQGMQYEKGEHFWHSVIEATPTQCAGYQGLLQYNVNTGRMQQADTTAKYIVQHFTVTDTIINSITDVYYKKEAFRSAAALFNDLQQSLQNEKFFDAMMLSFILSGNFGQLHFYTDSPFFDKTRLLKAVDTFGNQLRMNKKTSLYQQLFIGRRIVSEL